MVKCCQTAGRGGGCGGTAVHLRRLVEPILAFQRAPGEVGILSSLTSVGHDARHLDELHAAYAGTSFLDARCVCVTARTVLNCESRTRQGEEHGREPGTPDSRR